MNIQLTEHEVNHQVIQLLGIESDVKVSLIKGRQSFTRIKKDGVDLQIHQRLDYCRNAADARPLTNEYEIKSSLRGSKLILKPLSLY